MVVIMKYMILLVCMLLGVAFVTYFERKFLGYIQIRKGPNKLGFKGLLQPFSDAVKLFMNEIMIFNFCSYCMYLLSPVIMLGLMLCNWLSFFSVFSFGDMSLGVIYIMCCLSLGVYPLIMAGWFSSSKYSIIGSFRSIAQTISYEVSMVLIILSFIVINGSFNLDSYMIEGVYLLFLNFFLCLIWYVSMLAELNRTPFDLTEGESELVSGFNTEYGSGLFTLFFLAEYGMILFLSVIFSLVFLGGGEGVFFYLKVVLVVMSVIWIRGILPRIRYDKLMMVTWKFFLPISLFYLIFFINFMIFL
uniref:NADH-ubiquinone oxidoreductase chain 1 n=1 Tax=Tachaea chinensis TaxID=1862870 RepID=A0A7L4XQB4_9CRUS|nr:NADH dehydrogenase subunit 1 [Tachaea chinensis]